MHAAGYPGKPESARPKSIQTKTVILRLGIVIQDFDKERQDDATVLTGLRNEELHSSGSPVAFDVVTWLPQFTRVVDVVCAHLGLDPADLVGNEIIAQGRALVDVADKRLEHEISKRIDAAQTFIQSLLAEEIARRKAVAAQQVFFSGDPNPSASARVYDVVFATSGPVPGSFDLSPAVFVECPACRNVIPMRLQAVRTTNERLDDDHVVRDVIYIAMELACPVCNLKLLNTAEIRAAKLGQQYIRSERESLEERYSDTYEGEYGNE